MKKKDHVSTRVFSGMIWRFGERICAQLVSFMVTVILARILLPSEYGIIAMTTVFITVCNVFVTSGFGVALVQKENADDRDFSTILIFGFGIACLLYMILFLCAPAIAAYYSEPMITDVMRVMALQLPLAAIKSVQQAYVVRKMIFRKFFWATLVGTVTSAGIGIGMAYAGYGVWALVAQYLVNSLMDTVVLGITIHWFPGLVFSPERLRGMIGFGWRILLSDLISTVYTELRNLIIGKRYSAEQLAYYNRGSQIPHLFVTNLGVAISSVLLPVLSQEQNDEPHLRAMMRRTITAGTYVMFPVMAGIAAAAGPLVRVLLTEKWLPAVPFLRMACMACALDPWATANLQVLKARGKADEYLKLEIRKKAVAMAMLLISIPMGVYALAASGCLYSFVAVIMTSHKNLENIQYGFCGQIRDILPNAGITAGMSIAVYCLSFLNIRPIYILGIQIISGIALYLILSRITRNGNLAYIAQVLRQYFRGEKEQAKEI